VTYVGEPVTVEWALAEILASRGPLGLDIETAPLPSWATDPRAGLDPYRSRPRLLQVATADRVTVFDLNHVPVGLLAPLAHRNLVAHNATFELRHLAHAGLALGRVQDTMLMGRVLLGRRMSLADLAGEALGLTVDKALQTSDWAAPDLAPAQVEYAALDAVLARRLALALGPRLKAAGTVRPYQLMRDAVPAVAAMMHAGCPFDWAAHAALVGEWERDLVAAEAALREALGPEVNPASGPQLSAWLEAHLPADVLAAWPRTATGQLETGADAFAAAQDLPLVGPLAHHKKAAKLLTTYGRDYAKHRHPVTGRIHAEFLVAEARSGRFSCRNPNVQQLPRDPRFRGLFAAPEGRVLVVADYGQIELRVAALVAQDAAMLAAYRDGVDLHRRTAGSILGIPEAEVTRAHRQLAKAVNFGLLFGQGPRGLVAYARTGYGVDMTEAEARRARSAFFRTYPGLRSWQLLQAIRSRQSGAAATACGLVRDFTREPTGWRATEALNTPIQGGAAEVLLAALGRLPKALAGLDAQLVNAVHDELVLEAAEADAPAATEALTGAMVGGYLDVFPEGPTVGLVEAHAARTWAEAK
jgi:DNA polymerase-1